MTLEMPLLFTKLKSNNYIVSTDDLILIMLGWFSFFQIAFGSGSSDNLFETPYFLMLSHLAILLK